MMKHVGIAIVVFSVLLAGPALAQFDLNGPNASLDINGFVPSVVDPGGHKIYLTVPGLMQINVQSGTNAGAGIIMLFGPTNAAAYVVPWGGSIDVGNPQPAPALPTGIQIVADGIAQSANAFLDPFYHTNSAGTFTQSLSLPASLQGLGGSALQAIMADPTAAPFGFDNTECGEPNYIAGQVLTLATGDDGTIAVPFQTGATFNFYGINYTEVWVNANGAAGFTAPLAFPGTYYAPNTLGQIGDIPHISANWADWNPIQQNPNDGVLYVETGNTAEITWGGSLGSYGTSQGGISHFGDTDSGMFKLTMQLDDGAGGNPLEGGIEVDYITLDPAAAQNNDAVIGIVAGGGQGTMNYNQDFHQVVVGGPNDTLLEEHDTSNALPPNNIGYDGMGSVQCYHNGNIWQGHTLQFVPLSNVVTGDLGYLGQEKNNLPRPDDATSINVTSGSDIGSTPAILCGWYQSFDIASSVVFDPAGMALQAIILGVLDNSGTHAMSTPNSANPEYRDMEGISILTPPIPGGTANSVVVDIQVNFSNGNSFTIAGAYTYVPSGIVLSSYAAIADDGSAQHFLSGTNTVTYGGVVYSDFHLGSNGMLTFNGGVADFTPTLQEFFSGFQGTPTINPTPGIAVIWGDYGRTSVTTDDIIVTEDSNVGTVEAKWRNQEHWDSLLPAGDFSVTFGVLGPSSLALDHTQYIQGSTLDQQPIVGVTDGDDQNMNVDYTADISALQGMGYSSPASESIAEQFDNALANFDLTITTFLDSGVGPYWMWTIL